MNPLKLMQLQNSFKQFQNRHPKLPLFFQDMFQNHMAEGTILEVKVIDPDGGEHVANMKVLREDLQMIEDLKDLQQ